MQEHLTKNAPRLSIWFSTVEVLLSDQALVLSATRNSQGEELDLDEKRLVLVCQTSFGGQSLLSRVMLLPLDLHDLLLHLEMKCC